MRWHLLALMTGLILVWPALDLSSVFSADEGSYGLQERALELGSWSIGYAFTEADPTGEFVPYHGAVMVGDRVVPYVSHPLWPTALHWSTSLLGDVGLRALGVLSVVVVAAVAWMLAGDLGGDEPRPWAFWIGAASPVLANAWVIWAHAPSAALGALVVLGAQRCERDPRWILLGAAGAAGGVLLRSEGLLWAVAVALALIVVGATARARWAGALFGASAVGALVLERSWTASILAAPARTGSTVAAPLASRSSGASIGDRLSGLRIALIDGALGSQWGKVLGLAILFTMIGVVLFLRRRMLGPAAWLLVACSVLMVARLLIADTDPIPGLLPAAPAVLLLALWRPSGRAMWWLPLSGCLFAGAIAVSIYVDGGSFQWGGRFLSPITALVAALAAVGGQRAAASAAGGRMLRNGVAVALVGLLGVQGAGAIIVPNQLRRHTAGAMERVTGQGPDIFMTEGGHVARLDWQGWPQRCWIALPEGADRHTVRAALAVLARTGVARVTVAGVSPALLRDAGVSLESGTASTGVVEIPPTRVDATIPQPYLCSP